ncbi:MAG: efflux RND transporter permease subunit, partial [Actinomycetota bacterium]|nr:efflux RND transporter permease subunit [Actinomycetota bacterium]
SGARAATSRARSATRGTRTGTSRRPDMPPGLFGFLRADSPYPRLSATLGRGFVAVVGVPALVVVPMLLVMAMWLGLLAMGLDHVPQGMIDLLAIPPISSFFDLNIVVNIFGLTTGTILFTIGLAVIRSVIWAVLVSLVIESLDTGGATRDGVRRGLRAAPTVLGILLTNVALIFLSQILRFILGASIGSLAFFGGLVGGLYFLAFAPVIAVREGVSARQAMGISARAARLPGPRHLGMVFLYFSAAFFAFLPAGRAFSANPSLRLWLLVLAGTLAHMVFLAGFAHRYIVVEGEIPPPKPRDARPRRRFF